LEPYVARVALDYRVDEIFDIDDGMKVATGPDNNEELVAMSKTLPNYNAIDCGVFKCGYDFFAALEEAQEKGDCSLADACRILIQRGQMGGVDIGQTFWLDLDTPEAWDYLQTRTDLLFPE
jgi:choline kinase